MPYQEKEYAVYAAMAGNNVTIEGKTACDTLVSCLASEEEIDSTDGYWLAHMVRVKRGKGELFVSCDPLLMPIMVSLIRRLMVSSSV